ncbi:MAG: peptidoglycan DD-metalloendopeptidase family protein [Woeseia sp.]|nr:peptidoglycan DD-metalloendopeptidase family protein [Woeseia sp.]NNL55537.1 peptidoglycan DD-metalloendopeptidase family protein [Woeseia sp.]
MKPPMTGVAAVRAWLESDEFIAEPIVAVDGKQAPLVFDLGEGSLDLGEPLDGLDTARFSQLVERSMQQHKVRIAYGRWGERRALYKSEHFTAGNEARTVHLGIDVFCAPRTQLAAPLDGIVDIVANNARELDYGPMAILKHTTPGGQTFWTLYGHLGEECLSGLRSGMPIGAGERLGTVGAPPTNGNWPPHLHFQVILDLLDLGREFPGVAAASEQDRWLSLSPNPACFFPQVNAELLDGRSRFGKPG